MGLLLSLIFPIFLVASPLFWGTSLLGVAKSPTQDQRSGLTVVFDLGGVLIDTDARSALRELGLFDLMLCKIQTGKNPHMLKKSLYATLNRIQSTGNTYGARDQEGDRLPGLMCDWMTGVKSSDQLLRFVLPRIEVHPEWFGNKAEQRLIFKTARMMFTPKRFIKTRKVIADGVRFVQRCKKQGHRVVVLSNWDAESLEVMRKKYKKLFSLFEGVQISGTIGVMKPDAKMYQRVARATGSDICVLIDDQQENVTSARESGMRAILCPSRKGLLGSFPEFSSVARALDKLAVDIGIAVPEQALPDPDYTIA